MMSLRRMWTNVSSYTLLTSFIHLLWDVGVSVFKKKLNSCGFMTPSTLLFCDTDDGSSFLASIVVDHVLNKTTSNNSQRVVMKPQQPEGSYEIMIYIYIYIIMAIQHLDTGHWGKSCHSVHGGSETVPLSIDLAHTRHE